MIGMLGVILAPLGLILLPQALRAKITTSVFLILPIALIFSINLLMAKRQITLFIFLMMLSFWFATSVRIKAKKILHGLVLAFSFVAVIFYVGFSRSGFDSVSTQLSQNQHGVQNFSAPILGLFWGYIGSGPEFLSITVEEVDPLYKPFSMTNSFVLRRINSIIPYLDYETDVVPITTEDRSRNGHVRSELGGWGASIVYRRWRIGCSLVRVSDDVVVLHNA